MEFWFVLLTGLFFASAVYLMLSSRIIRIMLGVVLFGNAVNLLLLTSGRIAREVPPVVVSGQTLATASANPLPQALILTAIVISFSFFTFLMVLAYRAYQTLKTDETTGMRFAEPEDNPMPPVSY